MKTGMNRRSHSLSEEKSKKLLKKTKLMKHMMKRRQENNERIAATKDYSSLWRVNKNNASDLCCFVNVCPKCIYSPLSNHTMTLNSIVIHLAMPHRCYDELYTLF